MGYQPYTDELNELGVGTETAAVNREILQGLKRVTDVILSLTALIFLLPVLIPIVCFIKLSDGGPVIFYQKRIGRGGKEFRCLKFRTMVVDAKQRLDTLLENDPDARAQWESTQKLIDDPRITHFGMFLRRSSLDELPQLINILKGEMSIVGPRPIVRDEVDKYGKYFAHYCSVRPGLTGLWQVSGRSDTTYGERVAFDVKYVSHWSYTKDLKIMVLTVPAVLRTDGAR